MPGLSRPPASFVTVIGIAVAVALTATVLVETSDVLPRDVAAALTPSPWSNESPDSGQSNLVIVHGRRATLPAAGKSPFSSFVLGNVPAAFVAGVLAGRRSNRQSRPWTARWAGVFFAGFIFQAGGLLFTGLLFWGARHAFREPCLQFLRSALVARAGVGSTRMEDAHSNRSAFLVALLVSRARPHYPLSWLLVIPCLLAGGGSMLISRQDARKAQLKYARWKEQLRRLVDVSDVADDGHLHEWFDELEGDRIFQTLERMPAGRRSLRKAIAEVAPDFMSNR